MNIIEKKVYDLVKSAPWLKFLLRNLYQTLFDLLPKKNEFFISPIEYKKGYFFGFHDTSPFNNDNKKILANQLTIPLRMPEKGEKLNIGYFIFDDGKIGDFVKIGDTETWNYHKGCRLQWVDQNSLIFNAVHNEKLVSKIINIETRKEKFIDWPIDSVSKDGKWATSFSYERLNELMPGYGYAHCPDNGFLSEATPKQTGLFLINLATNKSELKISLFDLANNVRNEGHNKDGKHYVTHSEFSPDGKYVSFLHRWITSDIRNRTSRLIIYDLQQNKYFTVPTEGMVSHYVWNEMNQIIAYCNVDGIDCHTLFNIPNANNYSKISEQILNSDGHQSFIDNNSFITDTYPDKYRMAKLYQANISSSEVKLIASLYSPKEFQTKTFYKHIACDLHPRVSPNKKYVCFDAVRGGQRSLCVMKLTE